MQKSSISNQVPKVLLVDPVDLEQDFRQVINLELNPVQMLVLKIADQMNSSTSITKYRMPMTKTF